MVNVCWKESNGTYYSGCRLCYKDYSQKISASNKAGGTACMKGNNITNCEYQSALYNGSAVNIECFSCKSNYAVSSTLDSCVSFSSDANCRSLQSGGTSCKNCWHSYYWNSSLCVLSSNLVVGTVLVLVSFAVLFFN